MRIQHNIAAMNAYRNYNTNTSAVSKNLEKLSSGYKINRAGDDAAGLAISEKMRAQISGLNAASKNVKDGISLVKTAEGAMQEVQDMLNRMVTLATQSANGTYDNEVDRLNLQKEVDQLRSEINRIADSSNFNGIKLLDGSQEIKTSYTNLSSPASAADGMTIISDGQLGVDAQAGVFSYDLSQLKITVGGGNGAAGNAQNLAGDRAVSDPNWVEGTPAAASVSVVYKASAAGSASTLAASTAVASGAVLEVTIGGKKYTVTVASQASSDGTTIAASAATNGTKLLSAAQTAIGIQLNKVNASAAAASGAAANGYTKVELGALAFGTDGKIAASATTTEMKPRYTAGTPASVAASMTGLPASVASKFGSSAAIGSAAAAAINGQTLTITAGSQTITVAIASNAVASNTTGTAAKDAIQNAINTAVNAANDAAKGSGGNYSKLSVTLNADGTITATSTPMTDNAPEAPSTNASQAAGSYTVTFGGKSITLHLKAGEYSGADLAKEIANAINQAGNQQAGSGAGSAGGSAGTQIMTLAGGTQAPAGGAAFDGTLAQAKITASFNGSKLTITMDEPPKEPWNIDMTLKFHNGSGNGGEQFKPTVDVEPIDNTTNRQYAQATIDLNQLPIKDGYSLQLGNTTYTFAIGSDSRFKNAGNVVDLTDLTMEDFKQAGARGFLTAANRLSKAAAANSTFLVGSDTKGGISLTEKEGAIDYAVNNLAGSPDNAGTSGRGDGTIDGNTPTATDEGDKVTSTLADWKGLVKMGQASVSGDGLTLQIGDTSESYNQLVVNIGDIHTKALGIDGIDISTQAGAQSAVNHIRDAINTVSSIRGTLGATQNRLEHTANNLSVMTENIQDAESTIRDTDIAEEMMAYTKNNILVQSAQAMLAQANQIPQGVLQLLG